VALGRHIAHATTTKNEASVPGVSISDGPGRTRGPRRYLGIARGRGYDA
jgi:hypothetical protein